MGCLDGDNVSFGRMRNPPYYLTEDQVSNMLKDCADYAGSLSHEDCDLVSDIVFSLEKVKDLVELNTYLTFGTL